MKTASCHPDRPHYSRGLCKSCYDIAWRRARRTPPDVRAYNVSWAARQLKMSANTLREHQRSGRFVWRTGGLSWDYTPTGLRRGQPRADYPHVCRCGVAFLGRKNQRHCSKRCLQNANNDRAKARRAGVGTLDDGPLCATCKTAQRAIGRYCARCAPEKVCAYCEQPFPAPAPQQRYCSTECKRLSDRATRNGGMQPPAPGPRCRCGIVTNLIPVPADLVAAWGSPVICRYCLAEGARRAA